jgi:hypothetical protein
VNVLIDEKHNMRKNKEILIYGDKQVDFWRRLCEQ